MVRYELRDECSAVEECRTPMPIIRTEGRISLFNPTVSMAEIDWSNENGIHVRKPLSFSN